MSLWADYLREKTHDSILETAEGFATYRYPNEKTVYIVDIYVRPASRRTNSASNMADQIVKEAKMRGCSRLWGSVVPSSRGSTESVQVLLAYGLKLDSCMADFILFSKEI